MPGEQLERVSLKTQSKAITLHIADINVNDSVPENHAKIWFLHVHNKAIISLVDNECIFCLILARLFLRLVWQQDSCFHLLPLVLFSLLHKQAKQLHDKSKAGEEKKILNFFINKLFQDRSSLSIPAAYESFLTLNHWSLWLLHLDDASHTVCVSYTT